MSSLFAYGSLSLPEVMETLIGRPLESVPAVAQGYGRYLLRGRPYPGLIEQPDALTEGRVYLGVDSEILEVLDRFESDAFYERRRITIQTVPESEAFLSATQLASGLRPSHESSRFDALAYVVPQHFAGVLSNEPWSESRFRAVYLDHYLRMCQSFYRRGPVSDSYGDEPELISSLLESEL